MLSVGYPCAFHRLSRGTPELSRAPCTPRELSGALQQSVTERPGDRKYPGRGPRRYSMTRRPMIDRTE
eukprot:15481665-Alexandrium_andersonii.AAC.1